MKRRAVVITCVAVCLTVASVSWTQQRHKTERPTGSKATQPSSRNRPGAGRGQESTKSPIDPVAYARWRVAMQPVEDSLRTAQQLYQAGHLTAAEGAARETIHLAAGLSPLPQEESRRLIARIRMRQGRYREALDWFGVDWQPGKEARMDLDIALCYIRLGVPAKAASFYSDNAILRYSPAQLDELPGTTDPQSLEASILTARGLDSFFTLSGKQEALDDFSAAGKLAPQNGVIAYFTGKSLLALGRRPEAEPYLRQALQYGRGTWIREVCELVAGYPRR